MKFARYAVTELATVSIMEEDVVLVVDNSFDDQLSLSVGIVCLDNIKISYYFYCHIFIFTKPILLEYSKITGHQIKLIHASAKKNVPIMKIRSAQSKKKQEVYLVNIVGFKNV